MKKITLFLLVFGLLFSCSGDVYGGFLSSLAEQLDALNNNMGQVGDNLGANYDEGGIAGAFNGAMGDLGAANEANEQYRKATIKEFKDNLKKIVSFIPKIIKKAWGKFVDFLGKIRDLFICNGGDSPTPPANDPPADDPPASDPPADDPPADDPPVEEVPANDPPADDALAEEIPAESPSEEIATEEPPATEEPAEEIAVTEEPAEINEEPSATEEVTDDQPSNSGTLKASGTLKEFIKAFEKEANFERKLSHYMNQVVATEEMAKTVGTSEISEEARAELSEKLMDVSEENSKMEESLANHISSSLDRGSHQELDSLIGETSKVSASAREAISPLTESISRVLREKILSTDDKDLLMKKLNALQGL